MSPQYLRARAEARLATALTEYRLSRKWWHTDFRRPNGRRGRLATLNALHDRARWSTLHSLLPDDEPTWDSLRGEGYEELELRAIGGDR